MSESEFCPIEQPDHGGHLRVRKTLPLRVAVCLMAMSCAHVIPSAIFVPAGDEVYPAKPKDYEVVVFVEGHEPDQAYDVIGLVSYPPESLYLYRRAHMSTRDVLEAIDLLKKKAKQHGADALVDFKIGREKNVVLKARAVVFR